LLLQLRSGSIFAPSFGSGPQTFLDDLAQQIVGAPGQELHLGDELGPHPMHAAEHEGRAKAARARRLAVRERLA
jgi:hypothetical protein